MSGDLLVQEYGKYFNLKTVCLRAGCLTGETHAGVELHGFLSYLFKCGFYKKKYLIFGYKGKQVRDNLSSYDVATIIWELFKRPPKPGEIFNIGGGRKSNISVLEAIKKCELLTGNKFNFSYVNSARSGDHKFWITDMKKFKQQYPAWKLKYYIDDIFYQMLDYEKFKKVEINYYLENSVIFFKNNFKKRLNFLKKKKFLFLEISDFINNCISESKKIVLFCAGNSLICKNLDSNEINIKEISDDYKINHNSKVTYKDDISDDLLLECDNVIIADIEHQLNPAKNLLELSVKILVISL